MPHPKRSTQNLPIDRIFLDLNNPRHKSCASEEDVIKYLCDTEYVAELAKDIAEHGLDPLHPLAVHRDGDAENSEIDSYIVYDGNRRMCAIKLLVDPDRAPYQRRKHFKQLSENWNRIPSISAVVFADLDDLRLWVERAHQGLQGGIGQKEWSAEQKERHSKGGKNKLALELLDYAEDKGLLTAEDRKDKLTTVQRYLDNKQIRDELTITTDNDGGYLRAMPEKDFAILVEKFFLDLKDGKIHSRAKGSDYKIYAKELSAKKPSPKETITPEPLISRDPVKSKKKRNTPPQVLRKPSTISHNNDIKSKLNKLNNWKLESLYFSICKIELKNHTPLLHVGVWSFFETLTAAAGRQPETSFHSFLSIEKLKDYGFKNKDSTKSLIIAVRRISDHGNTTKHHKVSAAFSGEQLANDMETLGDLIIACIKEAIDLGQK